VSDEREETEFSTKYDDIERSFNKKVDILQRSWECVKSMLSVGVMKMKHSNRNSELDIVALRKNYSEELKDVEDKHHMRKLEGERLVFEPIDCLITIL